MYFQAWAWQKIYTQDDRETHPACGQSWNHWIASPTRWLLSHASSSWYHTGTTTRVNRWMKSVHWFCKYLEYHTFCTHFCKSAQCTKKSTQAETKLPFPRRSYTKLMCIKTRRVPFQSSESFYGYHFAMCGLSSYQGNTESRKNVPKKERQKLLN